MTGSAEIHPQESWTVRVSEAAAQGLISAGAKENLIRWLTEPQYNEFKSPIGLLIQMGDWERLDRLFWEVVPFGTGGRRGPMAEFGSATLNARTVAESAWGLGEWLRRTKNATGGRAVVTCDSRNRSPEFAKLTACVLAAQGLQVFLFESSRSTPELSYAVRHLKCDVGVMISASHNPPADNGFKAYWSHGGQVLSPHDKGIIQCVYEAGSIEVADYDDAVADGKIRIVGAEVDQAYWDAVTTLALSSDRSMPAIFTPLHGVGETSVFRILQNLGFDDVEIFEPQRTPDGNFPNVPDHLPNPERTQVFGPARELAKKKGIDLILASDPDADRLGVMVRGSSGEFVHLTGNRVGALLVDYILSKRTQNGSLTPAHFVVETLVTTPLIGVITRSYGIRVIDDLLVGFKYIGQTMDQEGPDKFVFGVEESLGYLAGQYARDKDAAIAAMYVMELASELRSEGKTLLDHLDELFIAHGYFQEGQRSIECAGSSGRQQIETIMKAFRDAPPTSLAALPLRRVKDYIAHEIRTLPSNVRESDLPKPAGDLLIFEAGDQDFHIRFAARPSGTEPKIKFYFFGEAPCRRPEALPEIKTRMDSLLSTAMDELATWARNLTMTH